LIETRRRVEAVLRLAANFDYVAFRVSEAKESIAAGIGLDRLYVYALQREVFIRGLNSLCKKNGMSFNIRFCLPGWDNDEREAYFVFFSK
jgi:hypothetical protein